MKRILMTLLLGLVTISFVQAAYSQQSADSSSRERTREQLAQLLEKVGPNIKIAFRRSEKQPFNYVGMLKEGLTNADSFEIVISVSSQETIHFRIFPHYNGAYLNVDKARSSIGLMRQMLRFSDQNFLFWGMDDSSDIFAGYNFTLESGFPDAAIAVVLRSIANLDKFVGEMKTNVDSGSSPTH